MPFEKGQSGNPTGRKKGKPNKTTEEVRGLVQSFIEQNIETLQADFDQLEPKDRLTFIERLLKHVLPNPLHELERLSDEQLDELIARLKEQNTNQLRIAK